MVIIGILGGVASGKSFVARQLECLGARRVDADRFGHDVLGDPAVKAALVDRWGTAILNARGEVERAAVANLVFAAAPGGNRELAFLEQLSHPRIAARIKQTTDQWAEEGVLAAVLDAAVLLKAGWDAFCDRILFVEVSRRLRLERARGRGWSEEEFAAREAAQEALDYKRSRADWVIDNGGSPAETAIQVQQFWRTLHLRSLTPESD